MGRKLAFSLLVLILSSCGEFVGFNKPEAPDTGALKHFKLYLSQDEFLTLQNSLSSGNFAFTNFQDKRGSNAFTEDNGKVRIRGNSSRFRDKKSFTLELKQDGEEIRYAMDAGGDVWFEYGLILYLAKEIGIHAPQFEPVALFINDSYEGLYNIVPLYNETLNNSDQYNSPRGELFKPDFEITPVNGDTHGDSEKKFPDDDNFSLYDRLIVNYMNMNEADWVQWIESSGVSDFEGMSDYMVLRDFFGILDTVKVNHYVYFQKDGFTVLPWDDDAGFTYGEIGGDSILTKRMIESEEFKSIYKSKMKSYFLDSNDLLDLARDYVESNYLLLKEASIVEPYFTAEEFENEYNDLLKFLTDRPQNIIDNNPDWDF